MIKVKTFWNNLTKGQRLGIIRENHFWDDLSDFDYEVLPKDLIETLTHKIKEKAPLMRKFKP